MVILVLNKLVEAFQYDVIDADSACDHRLQVLEPVFESCQRQQGHSGALLTCNEGINNILELIVCIGQTALDRNLFQQEWEERYLHLRWISVSIEGFLLGARTGVPNHTATFI